MADFTAVPTKAYCDSLEEKIEDLEDQCASLRSLNNNLREKVNNINQIVTYLWLRSLEERDREKAIQLLKEKTPDIKTDSDFNVRIEWDGLTIDELYVKDVIE